MILKKIIFAGLFGAAALFGAGCGGNACDDLADTFKSKAEECDIDTGDGDGDGEDVECTDELAKTAECMSGCIEDADCDALTGADATKSQEYGKCVLDCA